MEYGGFEGTILRTVWRGTVMLWTTRWEPIGDADESLAKGNLKFILHDKIEGQMGLVHGGKGRARLSRIGS